MFAVNGRNAKEYRIGKRIIEIRIESISNSPHTVSGGRNFIKIQTSISLTMIEKIITINRRIGDSIVPRLF
jgi:hypothetical protein